MENTIIKAEVEGYLTAQRVQNIFEDCLFKEHEIEKGKPIKDPVIVQGILRKFGFHPDRLEKHKKEIEMLFSNLPAKCGDGVSFLCYCYDKYNHLWTGSHQHMEQFISLGIAINIAEYCTTKEYWPVLPGGVPYIIVHFDKFKQKEKIETTVGMDLLEKIDEKSNKKDKKNTLSITKYVKSGAYIAQKGSKKKEVIKNLKPLPTKITKVAQKKAKTASKTKKK